MAETRTGFAFNNPDITSDYLAPSWGLVVSADELRYDELFGNKLVASSDSQAITDDQLLDYGRIAVAWMERELNIDILPRRIRYKDPIGSDGNPVVRTDFDDTDYLADMTVKQKAELYIREQGYAYRYIPARKEFRLKLRRRPVRDLLTAKFVDPYYGNTIIDLMPYRIVKDGFTGVCYFRPNQLMVRGTYPYIWNNDYYLNTYTRNLQRIFLIDYETGYENCAQVPDEIRGIIKKAAAITLMAIFGDGKSAAIASRSVNLNNVSESISTTMSATSAMFGARILQYQKDINDWLKQNRAKYSNTVIGVL